MNINKIYSCIMGDNLGTVAIKMLTADRFKCFGLIFGIAFGTLLMSQQVSMFIGVMKRTTSQIQDVSGVDVWIMNPEVQYLDEVRSLLYRDLLRVRSVEGVQWAVPFFKGLANVRDTEANFRQIILIGVDNGSLIGGIPKMLLGHWNDLKRPNAIIIDRAGFELIWPNKKIQLGGVIEINDQRAVIAGICESLAPFAAFPIVYSRNLEVKRFLPNEANRMSFILVKAQTNVSKDELARRIQSQTKLKAYTSKSFEWLTMKYYMECTGIPINFAITIALGFIVGAAISGQTFYIFILENLKQFGILKAIGITNKQILNMMSFQAFMIASVGYSIGISVCFAFLFIASKTNALRGFSLLPEVALAVLLSVIVIIFIVGIFSVRRALYVEPMIVFKG